MRQTRFMRGAAGWDVWGTSRAWTWRALSSLMYRVTRTAMAIITLWVNLRHTIPLVTGPCIKLIRTLNSIILVLHLQLECLLCLLLILLFELTQVINVDKIHDIHVFKSLDAFVAIEQPENKQVVELVQIGANIPFEDDDPDVEDKCGEADSIKLMDE